MVNINKNKVSSDSNTGGEKDDKENEWAMSVSKKNILFEVCKISYFTFDGICFQK